jgi:hypothetical protein
MGAGHEIIEKGRVGVVHVNIMRVVERGAEPMVMELRQQKRHRAAGHGMLIERLNGPKAGRRPFGTFGGQGSGSGHAAGLAGA